MSTNDQRFETHHGGLIVEDADIRDNLLRKPLLLSNGLQIHADPNDSVSERSERLHVPIDGYQLNVYATRPVVEVVNPPHIVILPGFIEHAGYGIGRKFQHTIARYIPHAQIHGIATDGYGPDSERYDHKDRHQHDLQGMGFSRTQYIDENIPEESPIIFASTSMGTIITKEIILNMKEERLRNVAGGVLNACALVERGTDSDKLAHWKKFGRFMLSVTPDAFIEIAHTPPKRSLSLLKSLWESGHFTKDDLYPLGSLAVDIISGSDPYDIRDMLSKTKHSKFGVLIGEKDPVGELEMWNGLSEDFGNLAIYPVKGRSHGIVVNPVRNGRAVSRILYDSITVNTRDEIST